MKTLRIIIAALLMAISSSAVAQVTVSTSQLNGTKWKIKGTSSGSVYEYSTSQEIWHRNDGSSFTYLYYLTDTPITSCEYSAFDNSKVGKQTKGRYIVTLNPKQKVVYCASIQSFDKKKGTFITKLVTKGLIGVGDGISKYEMVKYVTVNKTTSQR